MVVAKGQALRLFVPGRWASISWLLFSPLKVMLYAGTSCLKSPYTAGTKMSPETFELSTSGWNVRHLCVCVFVFDRAIFWCLLPPIKIPLHKNICRELIPFQSWAEGPGRAEWFPHHQISIRKFVAWRSAEMMLELFGFFVYLPSIPSSSCQFFEPTFVFDLLSLTFRMCLPSRETVGSYPGSSDRWAVRRFSVRPLRIFNWTELFCKLEASSGQGEPLPTFVLRLHVSSCPHISCHKPEPAAVPNNLRPASSLPMEPLSPQTRTPNLNSKQLTQQTGILSL